VEVGHINNEIKYLNWIVHGALHDILRVENNRSIVVEKRKYQNILVVY